MPAAAKGGSAATGPAQKLPQSGANLDQSVFRVLFSCIPSRAEAADSRDAMPLREKMNGGRAPA